MWGSYDLIFIHWLLKKKKTIEHNILLHKTLPKVIRLLIHLQLRATQCVAEHKEDSINQTNFELLFQDTLRN